MKIKLILSAILITASIQMCYSQGCVINSYNGFNRVFIRPTAAGARTFFPGNGNNFVRWEGQCGPHTYVETTSAINGTCSVTENGVTRNGDYYPTVSNTFTRACNVPLDDHIWWVLILLAPLGYFALRKRTIV
ncbi:MAG: hypothetical protein EOO47_19605 [Flavobacterium sp.]|nr:MAG: hypothetical protein EOO47_19605 [Flavobacterium sp.]